MTPTRRFADEREKDGFVYKEMYAEARNEALEEAAKICSESESFEGRELAERIRALKSDGH